MANQSNRTPVESRMGAVAWAMRQRRGSDPCGYPREPLVSYRINRQLSGWILPPLMFRAFGAHCHFRTHAVQYKCCLIPAPTCLIPRARAPVAALNSERKFKAQPPLRGSNLNLTPIGETIAVVLCLSR
jgi:hypothetical protein